MPSPSAKKAGEKIIHAASVLTAKVALRQAMKAQDVSASELARRLDLDEREVRRLLDPDHPSKIDRLDAALRLLGRRIIVQVAALAPKSGARAVKDRARGRGPIRTGGSEMAKSTGPTKHKKAG